MHMSNITSNSWCKNWQNLRKRPWCWEGLGAGGEGDDRRWDGWMASPTWWTWVWVNSGSWWWTGRPGVLWFMGSQIVGHDWTTELNWTELKGEIDKSLVVVSDHSTYFTGIDKNKYTICSTSLPAFGVVNAPNFSHSNRWGLICISLMTIDVGHHFMCLSDNCIIFNEVSVKVFSPSLSQIVSCIFWGIVLY